MTFKLVDDFGAVLTGRHSATRFRERIEDCAKRDPVVVDFDGVTTLSPSFADELFAKLNSSLLEGGAVRFEHLSPSVDAIAKYVMTARQRGAVL